MIQIKDAYLTTDEFAFEINQKDVVQLSFGPTHICLSLDAAYDLQYRLAAFLAHLEVSDYPAEYDPQDTAMSESHATVLDLALRHQKTRRLDS